MNKFKKGDKVTRTGRTYGSCYKGDIYTIHSVEDGRVYLDELSSAWEISYFELYKEGVKSLLGTKFTRGGKCVYTVTKDGHECESIKIEWSDGSEYVNRKAFLNKLRIGIWKTVKDVYEIKVGDNIRKKDGNNFKINDCTTAEVIKVTTLNVYVGECAYLEKDLVELVPIEEQVAPVMPSDLLVSDTEKYPPGYNFVATVQNQPETKQEEIMNNTINIEVSQAAFSTKTVTTIFGKDASTMNEKDLYLSLSYIKERTEALLALETGEASKRISKQLKELKAAKKRIVELIDALEE